MSIKAMQKRQRSYLQPVLNLSHALQARLALKVALQEDELKHHVATIADSNKLAR